MQRIALQRARVFGWLFFGLGLVGLIGTLALGYNPASAVVSSFIWVVILVTGLRRLVVARQRRLECEAKNGTDAGKQ
jgi:hypothetical protein